MADSEVTRTVICNWCGAIANNMETIRHRDGCLFPRTFTSGKVDRADYDAVVAERDRLRVMLKTTRRAIASLPEEALGRNLQMGYFYRDELLTNIDAALNPPEPEQEP